MGLLTSLSDVKTFLSIRDTSEDTLLQLLIPQVSALIEEYCDRTFGKNTYTEYYLGNGKSFFPLNQRPVYSITNLWQDDNAYWGSASNPFSSLTLLQYGVDYALEIDQPDGSSRSGLVFNVDGWWDAPFTYTPGIITPTLGPYVGNIKVTYVAGYAPVPAQIELACNMAIANLRNTSQYGTAISTETFEEYSVGLDGSKHVLTEPVKNILARFRNVAFV